MGKRFLRADGASQVGRSGVTDSSAQRALVAATPPLAGHRPGPRGPGQATRPTGNGARPTTRLCSIRSAPASRIAAASLGKIPTTSDRRPISLLTRSSGAWASGRRGSGRRRAGPPRRPRRARPPSAPTHESAPAPRPPSSSPALARGGVEDLPQRRGDEALFGAAAVAAHVADEGAVQRCHGQPRIRVIAALSPRCSSEIASRTPSRPRPTSSRATNSTRSRWRRGLALGVAPATRDERTRLAECRDLDEVVDDREVRGVRREQRHIMDVCGRGDREVDRTAARPSATLGDRRREPPPLACHA